MTIKKFPKFEKGFTMLELLVSMGIFLVLISLVSGSFVRSLHTQRDLVELISINDNANLTLEQMMREIRTSYNFSKISESEIKFVNSKNKIVYYRFIDDSIERGETDSFASVSYRKITSDDVRVKNFKIEIVGEAIGDGYQSRVTIAISITGTSEYLQNVPVNIQMTVSPRTIDS